MLKVEGEGAQVSHSWRRQWLPLTRPSKLSTMPAVLDSET